MRRGGDQRRRGDSSSGQRDISAQERPPTPAPPHTPHLHPQLYTPHPTPQSLPPVTPRIESLPYPLSSFSPHHLTAVCRRLRSSSPPRPPTSGRSSRPISLHPPPASTTSLPTPLPSTEPKPTTAAPNPPTPQHPTRTTPRHLPSPLVPLTSGKVGRLRRLLLPSCRRSKEEATWMRGTTTKGRRSD